MKTLNLLIFAVLLLSCGQKNFQGYVKYEVKTANPMSTMISDSVYQARIGDIKITHTFFIKENKYKNRISGTYNGNNLYVPDSNRYYVYDDSLKFAMYSDCSVYIDKYESIENDAEMDTILGYPCKKITMKSGMGTVEYFYSENLKINPEYFKDHVFNNWNIYTEKTSSVPLKIVYNVMSLKMTLTAIEIEKKELKDDFFRLPKFEQVVENTMKL